MSITVQLHGCRPEPLAHYLKALGILRIVSLQTAPQVTGWWEKNTFCLSSSMSKRELEDFFYHHYRPTPIIVPWSGNDFFGVNPNGDCGPFRNAPTATKIIEALLAAPGERLAHYRKTISTVLDAMTRVGLREKKQIEGSGRAQKALKARFIEEIRSRVDDSIIGWLDAATLTDTEKATFNTMLGSGGGSDGNSHFSDNFMQCVWICLPEFDAQRARPISSIGRVPFNSVAAIRNALFGESTPGILIKNLSPALFNSAAVGGPNATSGYTADPSSNPWDYIFMLEGACLFAGALSRREGEQTSRSAFPFLVELTAAAYGSAAFGEGEGREVWLPLWDRPASFPEVQSLFAEARAEVGGLQARRGLDMARAVSSFGVDRGITAFSRIGILKGRVGGENYNTSLALGKWPVSSVSQTNLISNVDNWLESVRRAAKGDRAPSGFIRAARNADNAIMSLCRESSSHKVQQVLITLGAVERSLARSPKFRSDTHITPLSTLSSEWVAEADDGSAEFRLACSIAAGGIRQHLEPVVVNKFAKWDKQEKPLHVVWNDGCLVDSMLAVVERRLIDSLRLRGQPAFPSFTSCPVHLNDLALFIGGSTDERRIENLLWGLVAVDWRHSPSLTPAQKQASPPLQLIHALIRLCFLPWPIEETVIPPTPSIISRARAGDSAAASRLASKRLYASGFIPLVAVAAETPDVVRRSAAALTIPIARPTMDLLINLALRPSTKREN